MSRRILQAGIAALIVISLVAVSPTAVLADDVMTIDAEHGLTEQEQIDRFQSDGVASTRLIAPNLRLTVADGHEAVGLSGWRIDADSVYLRVDYNESIERTVRFYIPSEYWYPITSLDHEATNTNIKADFEPTATGRYTAVTIHFTGQTSAVFEIKKATSGVFWFRSKTRAVVNNTTGYQPPRLGADRRWQYVPDGALNGSASYPINASTGATVQYDADPTPGTESWLSVPHCGGSDAQVCLYEKRGVNNKVFVLSKTETAPSVRWKTGTDLSASADAGWTDLKMIPTRIQRVLSSLLGGNSG